MMSCNWQKLTVWILYQIQAWGNDIRENVSEAKFRYADWTKADLQSEMYDIQRRNSIFWHVRT
jgi:predicted adenine nucleotide alpha hydrolase (AANH) superfamily ATPase